MGLETENHSKWTIFENDKAKKVHFSLYDKDEGKFDTMTLAEVKRKVGTNIERPSNEQRRDKTPEPSNIGTRMERQSNEQRLDRTTEPSNLGTNMERKSGEPIVDRTTKPSNLVSRTSQTIDRRNDECVRSDNREMENNVFKHSVHRVPIERNDAQGPAR